MHKKCCFIQTYQNEYQQNVETSSVVEKAYSEFTLLHAPPLCKSCS